MINFPLTHQPDQKECYGFLYSLLHVNGLQCPNGHRLNDATVHKRNRYPMLDYRCKRCGKCFNIFTGTALQGSKYSLLQIIHCFDRRLRNISAQQIAKELCVDISSAKRNCEKIKELVDDYKSLSIQKASDIDWPSTLKEIRGWEIRENIEYTGKEELVIYVKNKGYYSLEIKEFIEINPKTFRETVKKYTHVKRLRSKSRKEEPNYTSVTYNDDYDYSDY